ncbi:hypothetical protein AJ79_03511 [Helicocarpus griseus UAMH5409]|uniref:Uncharacterized protein n=1 Tax=Helicocarpus griseus UAMH5409 TaxID=1447875 RepID=A0A2B7XY05_9EURO|nr:hypothetical protein AJ79_03511 [Helicocarpus griseus UAMH5409]
MNRFRTRKKNKEAQAGHDYKDTQPLPLFAAKSFKKNNNKKAPVETKPELDLSSALPSSDEFRTSLLMPNLSARFSMLREQDDPNSKIGKANDDSVLFPKRASRLNLFGGPNGLLSDIAEVSSLKSGSARPSLAIGRGSYASGEGGYGTDDDFSPGGSVMSRSRPGEGNNLFGGRQKVYKIPVSSSTTPRSGSASEASGAGGGLRGRPVYEDDVGLSAFQKLRAKEKEQQMELELEAQQNNKQDTEDEGSLASRPSVNRTSTSNTSVDSLPRNSGPGATPSSTSKPAFAHVKLNPISTNIERNPTKTRRYGQGTDTQQPSAISRLESLSRQRAGINDNSQINRSVSKSATSLNEKFQNRPPVYTSSGFRPTSPPPSASKTPAEADDSANKGEPQKAQNNANTSFPFSPPLSPPISESEEQASLEAALQPEDRGKATAMGLFNKPASKYDDTKFSQRQRQMYEGRDTPPSRRRSPQPRSSDLESTSRSSREVSNAGSHRSKVNSLVSQFNGSLEEGQRSRDRSVASSIRKPSPARPANGGTFLSGSDSGSDDEPEASLSSKLEEVLSLDSIHPAFRSSTGSGNSTRDSLNNKDSYIGTPELRLSEARDLNTIEENKSAEGDSFPVAEEPVGDAPDSPTLGPAGLGLSGLVRAHLRHDSDTSTYQPPSPGPPKHTEVSRELNPSVLAARDANHAVSVHSNPWEYDDIYNKPGSSGSDKQATNKTTDHETPPADFSSMSMRAKQILGQATALSTQGQSQDKPEVPPLSVKRNKSPKSPKSPTSHATPWEEEAKHGHQRGGSSETQKEREELAHELAERRRKVHEKLRGVAESESRSGSPTPGHRFPEYNSAGKPGNAFAMLKNKSGRNPISGKQDVPQSKAMKMLGMDPAAHGAANDSWRDDERNRTRQPTMQRISQDEFEDSFYGERSPPSHRSSQRNRSSSDVSGRSKSQHRYRDDLGSVGEYPYGQNDISGEGSKSSKAPTSVSSSARPSVDTNDHMPSERCASAASGRFRSNSRSATQGFFDIGAPPPTQSNSGESMGNSPRPSPITPYSANATPPLYETSPIHPSLSAAASIVPSLPNSGVGQRHQGLGSHKKAIDKSKISQPKFVSSTSNVPTVGLPPNASLSNGATPPIPPMNPRRRRQTTAQTLLNAFKVSSDKSDKNDHSSSNPTTPKDEHSIFSDEDKRSKPRQRLRKISSEGGNMNAKARQQAMNSSSPALPQFPKKAPTMEGGMF